MLRELVQDEASPDGVGEQPAGQELAPGEDESPKSPDNHTDAFGQMLRELVQDEASRMASANNTRVKNKLPPKMNHQRGRTAMLCTH